MKNIKSIVIDAYGGDNAPRAIIEGVVNALKDNADVKIILSGKQVEIKSILSEYNFDKTKIEVINAEDVITNEDVPTVAIKTKKNSSLVVALERLKQDENVIALISAGSTGAILTGGFLKIGRLKGIKRPVLATPMPTTEGGNVLLLDCGANMDSKPEYLEQFALMGSLYMQSMFNIKNPKVALLSVGTEDKKGNELTKEAFKLINKLPINFVGNMEARDALSGKYDVIVADGFSGNILLKSIEGTALSIFKMLKENINSSLKNKMGALIMKPAFKSLKSTLNHQNKGGSAFLGAKKIIIKNHGSANSEAIKTSIEQALLLDSTGMYKKLTEKIEKQNAE